MFLKKINYSHDKFIDLCMLSGCDYLPYIQNLGINTAYTLLNKFNNIDNIIKLDKYSFPEEYNHIKVKTIFTEYNYENINQFKLEKINSEELNIFLKKMNIKNFK